MSSASNNNNNEPKSVESRVVLHDEYSHLVDNSKTTGQYHSTKGNIVEAIGNLTGLESWQTSGREEHAQGEAEYKAAQAKGYAEGAKDQLEGYAKNIAGAVTGDKSQQTKGTLLLILLVNLFLNSAFLLHQMSSKKLVKPRRRPTSPKLI